MFSHNTPCFLSNFKLRSDFMHTRFLLNYEEAYINSKMTQSVPTPVQTLWYYKVLNHPLKPVLKKNPIVFFTEQ